MRDTGLRFVNFLLHFTVVLCLALACRAQGASNIPSGNITSGTVRCYGLTK